MPTARSIFPVAFANVEPDLFVKNETDRGGIFTTHRDGVSQSALVARLPDTASEELRKGVAALSAGLGSLADRANYERSEVHPARLPDRVRELVTKYVSPAFQGITKAGVNEQRDADAAWKRVATPEAGAGTVRQEYRQLWQSLSMGQRVARIDSADIEELAAVIEGYGFFPDLDARIRDAIEHRFVRLGVAKLHALNGAFVKQTTAAEPLATGPDAAQIEAATENLIDGHKQRIEHLELVETSLRSVVTVIAAATELPIEDAYKLLMGRE